MVKCLDGVVNELLKTAASVVGRPLAQLFNACIEKETIPEKWKNACVVLLFKNGDPTDLKNYRPISLQSHRYNLFTEVLTKKINESKEISQLKDQAGFRSNRSTADHLHTLYQLKEKTTEFIIPLSLA